MNRGGGLWVGVILCGFGAALTLFGLWLTIHDWLAARRGQRATGRVVDNVKIWAASGHASGATRYNYFPVVEFRTEEGAVLRFQASYGSGMKPDHQVGEEVVVRYDSTNPQRADIVGEGRWLKVVVIVIGMVITSIGGACLLLR